MRGNGGRATPLNRAGPPTSHRIGLSRVGHSDPHPALLFYSLATVWVIHSPCLVVHNQEVENFLRSKFLVSVEGDGRVGADGEGVADVGFLAQLYGLRVVRRRNAQAVFVAADEEIVSHSQSPRICNPRHPNPCLARFRLGFCFVLHVGSSSCKLESCAWIVRDPGAQPGQKTADNINLFDYGANAAVTLEATTSTLNKSTPDWSLLMPSSSEDQSDRRACMTSTRAARAAGSADAMTVAVMITPTDPING